MHRCNLCDELYDVVFIEFRRNHLSFIFFLNDAQSFIFPISAKSSKNDIVTLNEYILSVHPPELYLLNQAKSLGSPHCKIFSVVLKSSISAVAIIRFLR